MVTKGQKTLFILKYHHWISRMTGYMIIMVLCTYCTTHPLKNSRVSSLKNKRSVIICYSKPVCYLHFPMEHTHTNNYFKIIFTSVFSRQVHCDQGLSSSKVQNIIIRVIHTMCALYSKFPQAILLLCVMNVLKIKSLFTEMPH